MMRKREASGHLAWGEASGGWFGQSLAEPADGKKTQGLKEKVLVMNT